MKILHALKVAILIIGNLCALAFLTVGAVTAYTLIIQAAEARPVVYVAERSSPPKGLSKYGFYELAYAYKGDIHRVQFLARAQRDAFERDYLQKLGLVTGPAVDMSKIPQDLGDAVGKNAR